MQFWVTLTLRALPFRYGLSKTMTQAELPGQLEEHGSKIIVREDHFETLRYLTSQPILAYSSISEFWSCSVTTADPLDIQIDIHKAKFGYYLQTA